MCPHCLWSEESGVTFLVNGSILHAACMSRGPGHALIRFHSALQADSQDSGLMGVSVLFALLSSLLPELEGKTVHFRFAAQTSSMGHF